MEIGDKKREAEEKAEKESLKLLFDVYKHITTLSSGSIVVICTFLEKVFKTPRWIHLVTASLFCFLISIVLSVYIMPHLAMEQRINYADSKLSSRTMQLIQYMASLTFVAAIFLLAIFSVVNFYKM